MRSGLSPPYSPIGTSVVAGGFAQRVLGAADEILRLAGDLLGLAFGLGLGVPGSLADGLLDLALHLARGALDAILVHGAPRRVRLPTVTAGRGGKFPTQANFGIGTLE